MYSIYRNTTATVGSGLILAVALLASAPANAALYNWTCSTGFWDTASCWGGTVPTTGDTANIGTAGYVVTYRNAVSPTPELTNLLLFNGATLNQSQDQFKATNETVGTGSINPGTYNHSGGSNTVTNTLTIGNSLVAGILQSQGVYNLSGTGALSAATIIVGNQGLGTFNQSGGTNNVSNALTLGQTSSGTGSYNLTGGSLVATTINVGSTGQGTFIQNGGTVSTSTLNVAGTYGIGSLYDLQSGSLTATSVTVGSGDTFKLNPGATFSVGTFNLNSGGTFQGNFVNQGQYNLSGIFNGNLTNQGTLTYVGGILNGNLTNQGTASLGGTLNGRLINQGTTSFGNFIASDGIENTVGRQFTIGTAITITTNGSGLLNAGTIQMSGGTLAGNGAMVNSGAINGYGTIGGTGGFTNNGSMAISGGNLMLSNTGNNVNNGSMTIGVGSQLVLGGADFTSNGPIALNHLSQAIVGSGTLFINNQLSGFSFLDVNINVSQTGTVNAKSGSLVIGGTTFTNAGLLKNSVGSSLFIQSPTMIHTGSIEINASGSVVFDAAITNASGKSVTLKGGALSAPTLTNAAGGTISGAGTITGNIINAGSVDLFGTSSVFGDLNNQSGGLFKVRNDQVLISGHTTNDGTIETLNGKVIFEGGLTNNGALLFDPSTINVTTLSVGINGFLAETGAPGDRFIISENFDNQSTRNLDWKTSHTAFQFNGGTRNASNPQTLETVGADIGNLVQGWNNNFMLGTLQIGTSDTYLKLVDAYDNSAMCLSSYCEIWNKEAMYVGDLILEAGTTLDLNGFNLYVLNSFTNNGGTILGGSVTVGAVPIPAAVWLFGSGLLGLVSLARRKKAT